MKNASHSRPYWRLDQIIGCEQSAWNEWQAVPWWHPFEQAAAGRRYGKAWQDYLAVITYEGERLLDRSVPIVARDGDVG